ncbi:hypothetical protein [Labrys neptuniae]
MCPIILGLVGTAVSVAGAIQQGNAAKAQADAQAAAQRRQAVIETQTGEYQAQRKNEEGQQIIGQQMAAVGGSGFTNDGSPTDVYKSTASSNRLDQDAIRWNATNQSNNLTYQAQLSNIQGKNAQTGSYLSAAGNLFGGLGQIGKMWDPKRTALGNVFGMNS